MLRTNKLAFEILRCNERRQGKGISQRDGCWIILRDKFGKVPLFCAGLWNIKLKNLVFILYAIENTLGCSTYIPQFEIKLEGTPCKYSAMLGEDGDDGVISNRSKSALLSSYMYLKLLRKTLDLSDRGDTK